MAPFLSFSRAREGRAESRVTQRPCGVWGSFAGRNFGRSGTSGSPGPRYGRPNASRAGCSLAARQAPSTARRHFPSRCGHEEQRLMVPGSVRHRPTTARETRGVAALPLNGATLFARRRAPPVRGRRDDSQARPATIGVVFSCAIASNASARVRVPRNRSASSRSLDDAVPRRSGPWRGGARRGRRYNGGAHGSPRPIFILHLYNCE